MTQEDKEHEIWKPIPNMEKSLEKLLLKDLCARLPYGVKVTWDNKHPLTVTPHIYCAIGSEDNIKNLPKLLLRPMSSMTEEERAEYHFLRLYSNKEQATMMNKLLGCYRAVYNQCLNCDSHYNIYFDTIASIDWLNAHHFDYRGLIKKGLAIEAPKKMYHLEKK